VRKVDALAGVVHEERARSGRSEWERAVGTRAPWNPVSMGPGASTVIQQSASAGSSKREPRRTGEGGRTPLSFATLPSPATSPPSPRPPPCVRACVRACRHGSNRSYRRLCTRLHMTLSEPDRSIRAHRCADCAHRRAAQRCGFSSPQDGGRQEQAGALHGGCPVEGKALVVHPDGRHAALLARRCAAVHNLGGGEGAVRVAAGGAPETVALEAGESGRSGGL
jgi:hypothetical protein